MESRQGVDTGDLTNSLLFKRGRLTRWVGYNYTPPITEEWQRKWTPDIRRYKLKGHWVVSET